MGSVNRVFLVGNLARDPEIRTTNSGDRIANLRVVTSEQWRDKATGERKEKAEFHSVVIFNENLARIAENHLRKGSTVAVEGALQTRKWQDQAGADRYSTEIVLQKFKGELTLLGGKRDDTDEFRGGGEGGVARGDDFGSSGGGSGARGGGRPAHHDLDDEIPF